MKENQEQCQRCLRWVVDIRTLFHYCLYDMMETGVPYEDVHMVVSLKGSDTKHTMVFSTLRVCKACRGSWMGAIKHWFNAQTRPEDRT